jgi:kinesin family protein 3/17/kinesin family protein 11
LDAAATPLRTPASKHRLNFPAATPRNANHGGGGATEHPVEVIGRIRNLASGTASALEIAGGGTAVRVRGDTGGCRDFTLDGVSVSEEEDLEGFYRRFVRSRIQGVRVGAKCTVMVYGPTGSGKSHTMFGCGAKQPGIVYRALRDILEGGGGGGGEGDSAEDDAGFDAGLFVQVAVLEIYNEEIYDLLAGSGATAKGNAPKVIYAGYCHMARSSLLIMCLQIFNCDVFANVNSYCLVLAYFIRNLLKNK